MKLPMVEIHNWVDFIFSMLMCANLIAVMGTLSRLLWLFSRKALRETAEFRLKYVGYSLLTGGSMSFMALTVAALIWDLQYKDLSMNCFPLEWRWTLTGLGWVFLDAGLYLVVRPLISQLYCEK